MIQQLFVFKASDHDLSQNIDRKNHNLASFSTVVVKDLRVEVVDHFPNSLESDHISLLNVLSENLVNYLKNVMCSLTTEIDFFHCQLLQSLKEVDSGL